MPQATRLIRLSILIFYASILLSLTSISLCNAESDYSQRRLRNVANPRPEPLNRDESNADWFRKSSVFSGDNRLDGSQESKRTIRAAPNRNWFGRSSFRRNNQGRLSALDARSKFLVVIFINFTIRILKLAWMYYYFISEDDSIIRRLDEEAKAVRRETDEIGKQ